jgi:hypothetical protein
MSIRPDPVRITELRDLSEEQSEELAMLQSGVRELRKQHGTAAQTEALAARLGPELASNVAAGTALFSNALLRFAFLGAGIIGLGMGAFWLSDRGDAERVRAPASIAAQQDAPLNEPPVLEVTVALPVAPVVEAAPSEPLAKAAPARPLAQRPRADKPKEQSADPEAELALLGRAQALLDRDPNGALDVLGEHARVYARGVFIEEREVLALEAESKLGHKALARARAQRFMDRFPRSAHARRVRTLLEPSP